MTEDKSIELLIFQVGKISCGINILEMEGINWVPEITPVYSAPEYIKGLLNLRGQVVTVFDLGKRLGLKECIRSKKNRIIIIKLNTEYIGLLVDYVQEVIKTKSSEIMSPPANSLKEGQAYFNGIFNDDNKLIAIVDVEKIVTAEN